MTKVYPRWSDSSRSATRSAGTEKELCQAHSVACRAAGGPAVSTDVAIRAADFVCSSIERLESSGVRDASGGRAAMAG